MALVLLVHGSNHGSWCWREVVPALTARGHRAVAVDLPSVSQDPAALAGATLDDDARTILDALDEPGVLVGHSAAGFAITRAAGLDPARVAALVYLCAYVPQAGATISDLARAAPGSPLAGAFDIDRTHRAYRFRDPALGANLYGDCPEESVEFARLRLGWQAIDPQAEAVAAPPADIPLHYITCAEDRTIPPQQQRAMAAALPGVDRHEIACGHSPFFAAPDLLGKLLHELAPGH